MKTTPLASSRGYGLREEDIKGEAMTLPYNFINSYVAFLLNTTSMTLTSQQYGSGSSAYSWAVNGSWSILPISFSK